MGARRYFTPLAGYIRDDPNLSARQSRCGMVACALPRMGQLCERLEFHFVEIECVNVAGGTA